jgi:hypothetical protein
MLRSLNISEGPERKVFSLSGDFPDLKTGFTRTGVAGVGYSL